MKPSALAVVLVLWAFPLAAEAPKPDGEPPPEWRKFVFRGDTYYRLPEEVARKLGLPRRDIPPEKNAATYYLQAMEKRLPIPDALREREVQPALKRPWTPKEFPKLAAWLQENGPAFALLEKGLVLDDCQFPCLVSRPGETFLEALLLPYLMPMRGIGRSLIIRGHLREAQKKPLDALTDYLACLRLGHHASQDGPLIGSLVGIALQSMGTRNTERLLKRTALAPKDLRALLAALLDARALLPDPAVAMRGERAVGMNTLDRLFMGLVGVKEKRPQAQRAFMRGRAWRVLVPDRTIRRDMERFYDGFLAAASREPWEVREAVPDPVRTTKPYNVLAHMLLPALDRCLVEFARNQARLEGLIQVVALRLYRAEHGKYPTALGDLVPAFLPALPPDPFTGKPFHYLVQGDGFVLYSVGPNRTDDAGNTREESGGKKDDIAFTALPTTDGKNP